MNSLDDKLRELAEDLFMRGVGSAGLEDIEDAEERDSALLNLQAHFTKEAIAQIKQLFAEEKAALEQLYLAELEAHKKTKQAFLEVHEKYRNSGQEWYDKFVTELARYYDTPPAGTLRIARVAAGIDHE